MSKTTEAQVEREMKSKITDFHARAAAVKDAHRAARKAITDDTRLTREAQQDDIAKLDKATRATLDQIKDEQKSYLSGLRTQIEKEFRGNQPTDANSVLLRRDAADRVRRITDPQEAMEVLNDAIANGDDSMAHAIGQRARSRVWGAVAEAYTAAHPTTAESAAALAAVEGMDRDSGLNLASQMAYSAP